MTQLSEHHGNGLLSPDHCSPAVPMLPRGALGNMAVPWLMETLNDYVWKVSVVVLCFFFIAFKQSKLGNLDFLLIIEKLTSSCL